MKSLDRDRFIDLICDLIESSNQSSSDLLIDAIRTSRDVQSFLIYVVDNFVVTLLIDGGSDESKSCFFFPSREFYDEYFKCSSDKLTSTVKYRYDILPDDGDVVNLIKEAYTL